MIIESSIKITVFIFYVAIHHCGWPILTTQVLKRVKSHSSQYSRASTCPTCCTGFFSLPTMIRRLLMNFRKPWLRTYLHSLVSLVAQTPRKQQELAGLHHELQTNVAKTVKQLYWAHMSTQNTCKRQLLSISKDSPPLRFTACNGPLHLSKPKHVKYCIMEFQNKFFANKA